MTRRRLHAVCLTLLAASLALHGWELALPGLVDRTGRLKCPDFLQFYTYGSLVRTGQTTALYDPAAHARLARSRVDARISLEQFHPNYSPVVAWIFAPLAGLPYLGAMAVWAIVSWLLSCVSLALLLRLAPRLAADPVSFWLVAAAWPTTFVVLRYGQLSALSLFWLVVGVRLAARDWNVLGGLALGFLAYKPNLLVAPALVFLFAGQWRLLAGMLAGASLQIGASIAGVGWTVFAEYLRVLTTIAQHPEVVQLHAAESHSVAGQLRLWSAPAAIVMAGTLVGLTVAVWLASRVWRATADPRPRWAALVIAALVASPHLLTYDLLLLAVPLVLLTDWRWETTGRLPVEAWLATLLLFYLGAMPGTMLARIYGIQCSTVGMGLGLWLLAQGSRPRARSTAGAGASSSMSPIMSS
jgi:alpha-1,2-mannosyltransferase